MPSGPNAIQGLVWYSIDSVRVAEYWYRKPITKTLLVLSDGRTLDSEAFLEEQKEGDPNPPTVVKKRTVKTDQICMRIMGGKDMAAADYIELNRGRADLIRRVAAITQHYDALVMPTVPVIAPPLAALAAEDPYRKVNLQVLRNPTVANMLDRCAISLPCHRHGEAPVGLMLIGEHGGDRRLFAIAAGIEAIVSPIVRRP